MTDTVALRGIISGLESVNDGGGTMEHAYTPADVIALPRWERTKGPNSGRPESRRAVRSGLRKTRLA